MSLHPIKSRKARHHAQARLKGRSDIAWGWGKKRIDWSHFFTTRKFKTIVILVLTLSTIGVLNQTPLFHGTAKYPDRVFDQGPDPTVLVGTRLFHILLPGGALTEFNTFVPSGGQTSIVDCHLSYEANSNCIRMRNNSTHAAIALTKSPTSLSSAANNNLVISQFWREQAQAPGGSTVTFGWYLTTNSTVPTTLGYDPRNDKSVFLVSASSCGGGCGTLTQQIGSSIWILRNIGDTLFDEDLDCGPNAGSVFFCNAQTYSVTVPASNYLQLNYTGFTNTPASSNCVTNPSLAGSGCSFYQNWSPTPSQNGNVFTTFLPPFKIQAHEFYYGLFIQAGASITIEFGTDNNNDDFCCGIKTYNAAEITNGVTTAGFFQPLVDAVVASGVFILNVILKFVAFIAPSIVSAISFLETVWVLVLNAIGGILGFGNVGTDLQIIIGNVLNFFTQQVPTIFANTGALFARFFDVNSVYFSWLPTALNIAVTTATLAVNGVVFVLTIIDFSFRLVGGVYLIILLTLFLVYTGDDALGGILGFLETTQWLILGPLGWLTKILNFALDLVTYLVGLIPKPFIQMVAHSIPRIPIIETSARFVNPSFDLAAIRNGNMLAVWAWFVDFTFLAWYNGVTPALPGSLGYLLPGMPATTFAALRGFLPMLEICLIVVSALAFIIWPVNKMFSMISLDLDILNFDMSPGRKISQTGLGTVSVKIGKKRLQGRLAKKLEKRKAEKIERETRKVVSVEEEKKIAESTTRLKEEHERLKKLEERNK